MERMRKALKRHYDLEVCEILPLEHGLWEESFKVQTGNTVSELIDRSKRDGSFVHENTIIYQK